VRARRAVNTLVETIRRTRMGPFGARYILFYYARFLF
jgi:hypothetical protein